MKNTQNQYKIIFQGDKTIASKPISLEEARLRHIAYLEKGPHIYVDESKILHSLSIDKTDLDLLCKYADRGIRLHLCREESGTINIIAVPIDKNGELNINHPIGVKLPIVNTLQPCPQFCNPVFSEHNLNSWEQEDKIFWFDPNDSQDGKSWFCKKEDGSKEFVEKPEIPSTSLKEI